MPFTIRALVCMTLVHSIGCYEHHLRDSVDANVDPDANMSVADTGVPFIDSSTDAQPDANDGGPTEAGTDARVTRDCYVPEDYPTIQAALDDSNCDPIIVTEHQWVSTVRIERDVTITTPDENTFITVNGDGTGSVFVAEDYLTTVTLERLAITGGHADSGGGVENRSALTLRDVIVRNNTAHVGGGITHFGGSLHLEGTVTFANNVALQHGGGMNVHGAMTFHGAFVVRDNRSSTHGGGIALFLGSLVGGPGLLMENNVAEDGGMGGAIYADDSEVFLTAPVFRNNRVQGGTAAGGAVYAIRSSLTLNGGIASGNAALTEFQAEGGFLYSHISPVVISGALVTDNQATVSVNDVGATPEGVRARGGAIAISEAPLELIDSLVMSNSASVLASGVRWGEASGGGIAVGSNGGTPSNVSIVRTSILRNSVTARSDGGGSAAGGGLALLDGFGIAVTIVSSTLSGNQLVAEPYAAGRGGAISIDDSLGGASSLNLFNTTIANNDIVANDAINAGIFRSNPSSDAVVTMTNSILWQNVTNGRRFDDCTGTIVGSYNLTTSPECFPSSDSTNQEIDPQLMPLTAVTDTCWVHPIATSSPAHDYSNDSTCVTPTGTDANVDQCGRPRSGSCDIGSVEAQP